MVATLFSGKDDDDRRRLFTARYSARQTGRGLTVSPSITEEGMAPEDRFSGVIDGVIRRSGEELGRPRVVEVRGRPERFGELLKEFESSLFEIRENE